MRLTSLLLLFLLAPAVVFLNSCSNDSNGQDNKRKIIISSDGIINNEILQYYEKEKVYGKKIIDMGGVNVAAGLSGFEQVGVAASYSF